MPRIAQAAKLGHDPVMSFMVSLIAAPGALPPSLAAHIAERLGTGPASILSPGEAAELACPTKPDPVAVTEALDGAPIDVAITPAVNRRKRVLVADMDSTIVIGETLDELAVFAGVGEAVTAITTRSMNGELDFAAALHERVALLKGLSLDALERTWAGVHLSPGARTLVQTMRINKAVTALVSGGFTFFTSRVAGLCGFDVHRANTLLNDGKALLGKVSEPVLDREAKLRTMKDLANDAGLSVQDCLAVGDGANDLAMIGAAGLGVAYHAKPLVAAAAQVRLAHTDLRALLFIQGYRAEEFVE